MCPVCSANIAGQETIECPKCHVDLSAYLAVHYTPDMLFNEAMQLIDSGEFRVAYDKLAAAHFMRPYDSEIIAQMARCCELVGDYLGAMEKLAILLVDNEDDSIKKEYERLNTLLEEQTRNTHVLLDEKMYAEIKGLILQLIRESVDEITAATAKPVSRKDVQE
jgi:tetratricopeptide (TPR) repeat protein